MGKAILAKPAISSKLVWKQAMAAGVLVWVPTDILAWPVLRADHPRRDRDCERKQAYLHLDMALLAAVRRTSELGSGMQVYACPFGLHWHMAKQRRVRSNTHPARVGSVKEIRP